MIEHASVYDPVADRKTLRVLIMRKWPRGIKRSAIDVWLKDAAPSTELLQAYNKAGSPWEEFAERYREEIVEDRPHVLDELRKLEREHVTLTLLCHERIPPHEHCHRLLLADLSRKRDSLRHMTISEAPMVFRPDQIAPFDRGSGVKTIPLLGKWNAAINQVTTGITIFGPGTGIPLHTHNVEETVLILEGDALVELGDQTLELTVGDATWAPAGVPHRFANRGSGQMRIYWVYGGRYVTRTNCATGVTVEHLSEQDRGAVGSLGPQAPST